MTILALINNQTNICENVSLDTRPANEITIAGYTVLDLSITPTIHWVLDEELNDYVEVERIGNGGIGYTYIDGKLVMSKPEKPIVEEQPITSNIEEI